MALRDHEKNAVFSILVRQLVAQDAKAVADAEIAAAKERADAAAAIIMNIRPALALFGFDITAPKLWDSVKLELGPDRYREAFIQAKIDAEKQATEPPHTNEDEGSSASDNKDDADDTSTDTDPSSSEEGIGSEEAPKIRELVIERLKISGDAGAKVGEIKAFIASQGIETHEKTAGMTLYRLSKEGLVRRDGRTWVYVPPEEDKSTEKPATNGSSASNLFD